MASRNLNDLQSHVAEAARAHLEACANAGIDLLIYCTLRDAEEQAQLFRKGRTEEQITRKRDQLAGNFPQLAGLLDPPTPVNEAKVTNAGPGESYHQYGVAYDCVPLVGGKPVWKTTGDERLLWQQVGQLGKGVGLEWAGDWRRFREFPHFQITNNRDVRDLMQERYGGGQPAVLAGAEIATDDESAALREVLDEPFRKVFVLAGIENVSEQQLSQIHAWASAAQAFNPAIRRLFRVVDPVNLDAELKQLLWPAGTLTVASVLSRGQGLNRQSKQFTVDELGSFLDVMQAFAWEPT